MKEQNLGRLARMLDRFSTMDQDVKKADLLTFSAAFKMVTATVLVPLMEEIKEQLMIADHRASVVLWPSDSEPRVVNYCIDLTGRKTLTNRIRFFAQFDEPRAVWQVIAELQITRTATELARFSPPSEITRDVAEQLLVDAVEEIFAYASANP